MYLFMTNKARKLLGIKESQLALSDECSNCLISWGVNIKRNEKYDKDILYLVNENSNIIIAICDFEEDKDNIKSTIKETIRRGLKKYLISSEVIERFINISETVEYLKSRDSYTIGRMNVITRFCEQLIKKSSAEEIDNYELEKICRKSDFNMYYDSGMDSYYQPIELFLNGLLGKYGREVFKSGVEIKIKTVIDNKSIYRNFKAPVGITFEQLHLIIQTIFSWFNINEYNFIITNTVTNVKEIFIADTQDEVNIDNYYFSSRKYIEEYFDKNYKCQYIYDFSERWKLDITFGDIDDEYYDYGVNMLKIEGETPAECLFNNELQTIRKVSIIADKKYDKYIDMIKHPDITILPKRSISDIKKKLKMLLIVNTI